MGARLGSGVNRRCASTSHFSLLQTPSDGSIAPLSRAVKPLQQRSGRCASGSRGFVRASPLAIFPQRGISLSLNMNLCYQVVVDVSSGRRMVNVAPAPSVLVALMLPLCASTSAFAMANPKPDSPLDCARALSAR